MGGAAEDETCGCGQGGWTGDRKDNKAEEAVHGDGLLFDRRRPGFSSTIATKIPQPRL
jgi:hypothetical protein